MSPTGIRIFAALLLMVTISWAVQAWNNVRSIAHEAEPTSVAAPLPYQPQIVPSR
jgi:hypothetical protein